MRVWRICKERWAATAWDGEGARRFGGRWNHAGDQMIYAASSLSLAALETLVHVEPRLLPVDLVAVPAELPDPVDIETLETASLPPDWRRAPAPAVLQDFGSLWLRERRSLVLEVPSAVIPVESCFLLNPLHERIRELRSGTPQPFRFDTRLFER